MILYYSILKISCNNPYDAHMPSDLRGITNFDRSPVDNFQVLTLLRLVHFIEANKVGLVNPYGSVLTRFIETMALQMLKSFPLF